MPILSPTGAPLVDFDHDSPREDLPQMLEDLVHWIDQGRIGSFGTIDDARAAYGFLSEGTVRVVWIKSTKTLMALFGSSSMVIASLTSRWSNFRLELRQPAVGSGDEIPLEVGPSTSARVFRSTDGIIHVNAELTRTSFTHVGSAGWYEFVLPVQARKSATGTFPQTGTGFVVLPGVNPAPATVIPCTSFVPSAGRVALVSNLTGQRIGWNTLGRGVTTDKWAAGHRIGFHISYEPAVS